MTSPHPNITITDPALTRNGVESVRVRTDWKHIERMK